MSEWSKNHPRSSKDPFSRATWDHLNLSSPNDLLPRPRSSYSPWASDTPRSSNPSKRARGHPGDHQRAMVRRCCKGGRGLWRPKNASGSKSGLHQRPSHFKATRGTPATFWLLLDYFLESSLMAFWDAWWNWWKHEHDMNKIHVALAKTLGMSWWGWKETSNVIKPQYHLEAHFSGLAMARGKTADHREVSWHCLCIFMLLTTCPSPFWIPYHVQWGCECLAIHVGHPLSGVRVLPKEDLHDAILGCALQSLLLFGSNRQLVDLMLSHFSF